MARLWSCGFELQSAVAGVEANAFTTAGIPVISTSVKRAPGTASLRSNPAAGQNAYVQHQLTSGGVIRTFHRIYFRFGAFPASGESNIYSIGSTTTFPGQLRLRSDGKLILRDGVAGSNLGSPSDTLELDRWYRVELDFTDVAGTPAAGTSAFKMYIDGALVSDQVCTNINGFSSVRMGPSSTVGLDLYIDDVAINDTSGSVQNDLPGPGCIVHLYPNAAGDNNGFTTAVGGTAGAANNYTRVNERTPNDATSYNGTSAAGTTATDDFNLESAASAGIGAADSVTLVAVVARLGSDSASAANLVTRVKSQASGTVSESASITLAVNGWVTHRSGTPKVHQHTAYVEPQAGGPWTQALLETAQVGYRSNVSQTTIRRVSTLWAMVEVIPKFALGTATEVNTVEVLGYETGNAPLTNLIDNFDDNSVDTTKWPNSVGTYTETGGRARVDVDTGTNAYASARGYTLTGYSLITQVFPPTMNDGSISAYCRVAVKSSTAGTELGFEFRVNDGKLIPYSRVANLDLEAPELTYNSTDHRWVRIREASGQVFFDTSADGHAWTNRRTIDTPAYADDGDLEVQLSGHRTDGTNNYAEFDNVNVLLPQSVNLGVASEEAAATALSASHQAPLSAASEDTAATALAVSKIDVLTSASTSEAAKAVDANKVRTIGSASTDEAANPVNVVKTRSIAPAGSTEEQAGTVTFSKRGTLGAVPEESNGFIVKAVKRFYLGIASDQSTATEVAWTTGANLGVAQVDEVARPLIASKRVVLGAASEESDAQAQPAVKSRVIGAAGTEDTTEPLVAVRRYSVAPGTEEAAGSPVTARKNTTLGTASTQDEAHGLILATGVNVQAASTRAAGRPVTARKSVTIGVVSTDESARSLAVSRRFHLGTAIDASSGRAVSAQKTEAVNPASAEDTAGSISSSKSFHLGAASDNVIARGLTSGKRVTVGTAGEKDAGRSVTHSTGVTLAAASTEETATPLVARSTGHLVNAGTRDTAAGVAARKRLTTVNGVVGEAGLAVQPAKRFNLGTATEVVDAERTRLGEINRMLFSVSVVEQARPVVARKRQPASSLVPSVTGSTLIITVTAGGS